MKTRSMAALLCLAALSACETMPSDNAPAVAPSPSGQSSQATFFQPPGDAPLVHSRSGFSFPGQLDNFQRKTTLQYDRTGDDVSVGYNNLSPNSPVVATVYVYPARKTPLAAEFTSRQLELLAYHAKAQLIATSNISVSPRQVSAMAASYRFTDSFGGVSMPLTSVLLVAECGKRYVEYRFTFPDATAQASAAAVIAFERDFAWP